MSTKARRGAYVVTAVASVLLAAGCAGGAAGGTTTGPPGGTGSTAGTTGAAPPTPDLAAAAEITATAQSQCDKTTRTFTDISGNQVSVSGQPARIVTIEPSTADEASLVGYKPVGVGDDNDPNLIIPQIKSRLGSYTTIGTRESPNLAVIASLHPDLIIADPIGNRKVMDQLKQIATTVSVPSQHTTYEQNIDAAKFLGAVLGKCQEMAKVISAHQATMAAIKSKLVDIHHTFIYGLGTDKNFTVFNYQQYATTVVQYLGLTPSATDPKEFGVGDATGVSLETLVTINPDIIFYSNVQNAPTSIMDTWKANTVFQSSSAAKNKATFEVDQHGWSLMRGLTGAEVIAKGAVDVLQSH